MRARVDECAVPAGSAARAQDVCERIARRVREVLSAPGLATRARLSEALAVILDLAERDPDGYRAMRLSIGDRGARCERAPEIVRVLFGEIGDQLATIRGGLESGELIGESLHATLYRAIDHWLETGRRLPRSDVEAFVARVFLPADLDRRDWVV